jgi:hypothetical protein
LKVKIKLDFPGAQSRYDDDDKPLFKVLQHCSNVDLCVDPEDKFSNSYTVDDPLVRPFKIS